jgi:hypothetical protein
VHLARRAGVSLQTDAESRERKRSPRLRAEHELTRRIREGVRPAGFRERLALAFDKWTGAMPLGVDAPNRTARKWIAGSAELLELLRAGMLGALASALGVLLLALTMIGDRDLFLLGVGGGLLAVGVWCLRLARRAYRNLRAITQA